MSAKLPNLEEIPESRIFKKWTKWAKKPQKKIEKIRQKIIFPKVVPK